jgi:hypothetical protein
MIQSDPVRKSPKLSLFLLMVEVRFPPLLNMVAAMFWPLFLKVVAALFQPLFLNMVAVMF